MRIDYNKLTADVTDALTVHGLDDEQAKILASSFVSATAAGVATHGVSMLGAYLKKLTLGQFNTAPDFKFIKKQARLQLLIRITQSVPFPQNIVWILPFHPQKSKEFIPSFHEIAIHTDLRFIIQKSQATAA